MLGIHQSATGIIAPSSVIGAKLVCCSVRAEDRGDVQAFFHQVQGRHTALATRARTLESGFTSVVDQLCATAKALAVTQPDALSEKAALLKSRAECDRLQPRARTGTVHAVSPQAVVWACPAESERGCTASGFEKV